MKKILSNSKLNKADSNRGAAMVTVVIVMMVVSILGLLALSISYDSFQMKYVEKHALDNFYGAEKVLEEICVELQEDVSDCYNTAYTEVMADYDSYTLVDDMQKAYKNRFYELMTDVLQEDTEVAGHYTVSNIQNYVADRYSSGDAVVTVDAVSVTNGANVEKQNILDESDGALYIRNVYVKYVEDGYSDTITTDLRIDAPDVTFTKIASVPAVTDYAVIADGGIEATGNNRYYTISGKTFAGFLDPANPDDEPTVSVNVTGGANLLMNSVEAVAEGDIEVKGNSKFTANAITTLWANGISTVKDSTDANTVTLLGKTYVKDDTTINGKNNRLQIGGEYYGYSGSTTSAAESSAIIINGTGTTVDMSTLNTMVLAGTSFVGTKGELAGELETKLGLNVGASGEVYNKSDVLMGDSVAVKTNQLIYMLPSELCVDNEGNLLGNPMSYESYKKIAGTSITLPTTWKNKALSTPVSGLGRSIGSYGEVTVTPIFSNKQNGTVYLYLEFATTEAASEYFLDCYGTSVEGQKAEEYFKNYLSAFTASTDSQFEIQSAGNYLVQAGVGSAAYRAVTADIADVDLGASFDELIMKSSFENVINEDALEDFDATTVQDALNASFTGFEGTATIPSSNEVVAVILVDNEGGPAFTVDGSIVDSKTSDGSKRMVLIATGDVTVTNGGANPIKGLIICKGTLTAAGSGTQTQPTSITYDKEAVSYALRIANSKGEQVMSVFAGNEGISAGSVTAGKVTETEDIDLRNCITYENWKAE